MTQRQIILEVICWILTAVSFAGSQLILHRRNSKKHYRLGLFLWLITDTLFIGFYFLQNMWALTVLSIVYTIQTLWGLWNFYKPKRKKKKHKARKNEANELTKRDKSRKQKTFTASVNDFT